MPTADPAGTIATRTAGLAEVRATFSWDRPQDAPAGTLLPDVSAIARSVRCELAETPLPCGTAREVSGTVLALTEEDLGSALESVLRGITAAAALSDALLESRVLRVARPRATPQDVLEALALDLWAAGFSVRFAPSWKPVPAGTVALGGGGDEDGLGDFLANHPAWNAGPSDHTDRA